MRKALIVVLLFVVVAIGALYERTLHPGVSFVSGFIEAQEIRVGSRIGGRVQEVRVFEGQSVQTGDLLVILEPYDLEERLAQAQAVLAARQAALTKLKAGYRTEEHAQAQAERDRLKAELEKLVAGPRPLEIQILQDKLGLAQAELGKANDDYKRIEPLFRSGQASQEEFDGVTRALEAAHARAAAARDELALAKEGTRAEDLAAARARLAKAEGALALLESGYRPEEIAEADAGVHGAEADVAAIRRQIAELRITAPGDALVEAIDLEPGDLISPNAPVISLMDPQDLWVRAYVPENRLDLAVDQKVSLRVDSFPDRRFAGHITFISRQAEFTPANVQTPDERSKQVFRIKVTLDEEQDLLRAGMAADVFLEPRS